MGTTLLAAAAPARSGEAVRPGAWRTVTTLDVVSIDGAPPPPDAPTQRQDDSRCIATGGVAAIRALVATGLPAGCAIPQVAVAGGRIAVTGVCAPDGSGPGIDFTLDGSYAAERIDLTVDARAAAGATRMRFAGTVVATRTGACPGR